MSRLTPPEPYSRVVAILVAARVEPGGVLGAVGETLGTVAAVSGELSFAHTDYYEAEMGRGLRRFFAGLEGRRHPEELPELKVRANELEGRWIREGRRGVNLDPGLLNLHQLVLATGKPAGHRVHLARGVYAEVEYVFADGTFRPLPWTYPDYRTPAAIAFFNGLRRAHKASRRESNPTDNGPRTTDERP